MWGGPSTGAASVVRLVLADGGRESDAGDRDVVEPVGIVIAGPSRAEPAVAVLAYVWGPAPELAIDEFAEQQAA